MEALKNSLANLALMFSIFTSFLITLDQVFTVCSQKEVTFVSLTNSAEALHQSGLLPNLWLLSAIEILQEKLQANFTFE